MQDVLTQSVSAEYSTITSVETLARLADKMLSDGKPVGFDVETGYYGPDFRKRSVDHYNENQFTVGFSLTNSTNWARYVPLYHDSGGNIDDPKGAWDAVSELLTKGDIVCHNSKFENEAVWKANKIELAKEGKLTDTIFAAYVISKWAHSNYRTIVGLKDLVLTAFGHKMMHIHELWPDLPVNKEPFIRFNTLDVTQTVTDYACEDSLWVLPLRDLLVPQALDERAFMYTLEHKIMKIMAEVERHGVTIDWPHIEEAYAQAQSYVPQMELYVKEGLSEMAGRDVTDLNLNSPLQLKRLLFEEIGLSTTRMTKKGQDIPSGQIEEWKRMSSDAKALVALSKEYPAIKNLLEFREVKNLNNRLKKWLSEYNVDFDGKVHPNYNQVVVPSGRFSANDPAIQQLPKDWLWLSRQTDQDLTKSENKDLLQEWKRADSHKNGIDYWSGNFRDFIIAAPDTYLLTYDYSQVELRILAGASQEPALLDAFENGADVHTLTAALVLGKSEEEVDPKKERPIGKTFNFALMYGMGIKSLAEQLGTENEEAKALHAQYFSAFSRVASYFSTLKQEGLNRGYAETIFGRKVPIWELQSPKRGIVAKGERILINGPIQGSAADYMKMAMFRAYTKLVELGWWGTKCTIIMNQHDALTFEVSNELDPNEVRAILQPCISFDKTVVPRLEGYPVFRVDWELGQKWGSSPKWDDEQAVFNSSTGLWEVDKPPVRIVREIGFTLSQNPSAENFAKFKEAVISSEGDVQVNITDASGKCLQLPWTVGELNEKYLSRLLGNAIIEHKYEDELVG